MSKQTFPNLHIQQTNMEQVQLSFPAYERDSNIHSLFWSGLFSTNSQEKYRTLLYLGLHFSHQPVSSIFPYA